MILINRMCHILKKGIYELFKSHVKKAYRKQYFSDFHGIFLQFQMLVLYIRHVRLHQSVCAC